MEEGPERRAISLQHTVGELEVLVGAAVARGVEPTRCREVIEGTVRRARCKASMLAHLDSSLLLSTLEQAKSEIAGLAGDVTATNAAVMRQELLQHQERAEETGAVDSDDLAALSIQSLTGDRGGAISGGSSAAQQHHHQQQEQQPALGKEGEEGSSSQGAPSISAFGSYGSAVSSAVSSSLGPRTPPPLSTLGTLGGTLSPADAVAPMRDFASEMASEAVVELEERRSFRHSLLSKQSKSGELRVARSYDFDQAVSPRADYHTPDQSLFAFAADDREEAAPPGLAPPGEDRPEAQGGGEEGEECLLVYRRTPDSGSVGGSEQEAATASSGDSLAAEDDKEEVVEAGGEEGEAGDGEGGPAEGHAAGAAAGTRVQWGSPGGGESHCCAGVPPGFNAMASVEGDVSHEGIGECEDLDCQSPTGMGAVDLESYSSAPFSLHSVTPPRHVMQALAAEMQGRLRL